MRKLSFVPLFAAVVAGLYACTTDPDPEPQFAGIDSGSTQDTGTTPPGVVDSGTTPVVDGGFDGTVLPDAQADALVDAALPIVVLLLDADGKPLAQTDVYFTPTGAAPIKATTGTDGRATFASGEGSIAVGTKFDTGDGDEWNLNTVSGVKGGDVIRINTARRPDFTEQSKVTGTIAGNPANTQVSVDFGSCGYTSEVPPGTYLYTPYKSCVDSAGKVTLLFVANNGQGDPVAYAVKQVALATDAGATVTQNIVAADWQVATSKTAPLQGTLAPWADEYGRFVSFPLGTRFYANRFSAPSGNAAPFTVWPPPAAPFANAFVRNEASEFVGPETRTSGRYRRVATGGSYADDSALLPPRIASPKISGTNTTPIVAWTADAALGADAIGSAALTGFFIAPNDAGHEVRWHAVFPVANGASSATLPSVPAALAAFVTDAAEPWNAVRIALATSPQVTYAQARLVPSVFESPFRFLGELPSVGDLELRVTEAERTQFIDAVRAKGRAK